MFHISPKYGKCTV